MITPQLSQLVPACGVMEEVCQTGYIPGRLLVDNVAVPGALSPNRKREMSRDRLDDNAEQQGLPLKRAKLEQLDGNKTVAYKYCGVSASHPGACESCRLHPALTGSDPSRAVQDPPSPLSKYVAEQVTLHLGQRLEKLEQDSATQKELAKKESEKQAKNAVTVMNLRNEARRVKAELAVLKSDNSKLSDQVAGQERSMAAMKKDYDGSMAAMQKAFQRNTGLLRAHGEVLQDGKSSCLSGCCDECLLILTHTSCSIVAFGTISCCTMTPHDLDQRFVAVVVCDAARSSRPHALLGSGFQGRT